MRGKRVLGILTASLLIIPQSLTAFADVALPEGAVKGLPERLVALDNEGNAVNSATGEYFFHVENMAFSETYFKEIQFMNLREDYGYHIWFTVEPKSNNGEIDLEKECVCRFFLDGNRIYQGDVSGHGDIDITSRPLDLGWYAPGDSHILRAEVVWNVPEFTGEVDFGHRLVDRDGEHVLVPPSGNAQADGEIEFKWIFYASVYEPDGSRQDTETTSTTTTTDPNFNYTDEFIGTAHPQTVLTDIMSHTTSKSASETTVTTTIPPDSPEEEPTRPDSGFFHIPFTGYLAKDGKPWLICMGIIGILIVVLLILIHRKKRQK